MSTMIEGLNPPQAEAVTFGDGPLLILAGAGSGKTKVLTCRIAYLISERGVKPWNICAITFTNKAAGEMRQRVDNLVGFGSESINVATFHSTCVRILRRFIDRIGYQNNFTIYDSDDSKSLMKDICRQMGIDTKETKEKAILAWISHQKDELISPEKAQKNMVQEKNPDKAFYAQAYEAYQNALKRANAVDFDDLIGLTVRLFWEKPDVLEYYQDRYRYLLVDEYQDTNKAQFVLISILARKYRNLCVVGDDDQSIYRFRGADIGNILNFEKIFPDAKVIKLEQNYRSTTTILDAAYGVISQNRGRKDKHLWSENGKGEKIRERRFEGASQEAYFIVHDILEQKKQGAFDFKDSAILYRTNAQSRVLEEQLILDKVPYTIVGGINFYARKEIKDLIAYLKTIENGGDDLAVRRIINIPRRGIGTTSITRVADYAAEKNISFYDALLHASEIPGIGRALNKLNEFVTFIANLRTRSLDLSVKDLLQLVIENTGYVRLLEEENTEEAEERIENIEELISDAASYDQELARISAADRDSAATGEIVGRGLVHPLSGYLEHVALVADIDSIQEDEDRVLLMTLHSAKGLEFGNVYLCGMDQGLFPSYHAVTADDSADLEEERRLCYVGITRAKKRLTLTGARMRLVRGDPKHYAESMFIEEIPDDLLIHLGPKQSEEASSDMELPGSSWRNTRYGRGYRTREESGTGPREPSRMQREKEREMKEFHEKPFYMHLSSGNTGNGDKKAKGPLNLGSGVVRGADKGKPEHLGYGVGDRVRHVKFGEGTVAELKDGARDMEVTVQFDSGETKKMLAGFAKLVKIE